MSLSDSQIRELGKRLSIPIADICFKDELPEILEFNKAYFINLQDSVDQDGQPSPGTHWTYLQCVQYPKGQIESIYFDPYGVQPPEYVKEVVKNTTNNGLPYTTKDIQSLLNNACGYYCLAFGHFINASQFRTGNLFQDTEIFLSMFDDLNKSTDFKKNEYILKHFFRSSDPEKRVAINVDNISADNEPGGIDAFKLPVDIKYKK
jgi:hypothetical protein